MTSTTYDSPEAIEASLGSLRHFLALCRERREAGYGRRERMAEFVVLGRYWLDTCGNLAAADATLPDAPPVLTRDVFWQRAKRLDPDYTVTMEFRRLPDADDFCHECMKRWTSDLHDSLYYYANGDEVEHFLHAACASARSTRQHCEYFRVAFTDAGFQSVVLTPRENGYTSRPGAPPWFNVETELGNIVIGWRKRVVNIDYSAVVDRELFPSSGDTHYPGLRHVWTTEALVEVLRAILESSESACGSLPNR